MDRKKRNVLIIEHEVIIALDIKKRFLDHGYHVTGAFSTIKEAISKRKDFHEIDLILLDSGLSDFKWHFNLVEKIYDLIKVPVIILVSNIDDNIKEKCRKYDTVKIIEKPFRNEELMDAIGSTPFCN